MNNSANDRANSVQGEHSKKLYKKPAFRCEKVFEVQALTCGKVQTTQSSCAHNRKAS